MRWYENGHLWQRNHYVDDEEAFPCERWYYTKMEGDDAYPYYTDRAPNGYQYTYRASEGFPLYYIEETYTLKDEGKKYLLEQKYFKEGYDEPIYFTDTKCDSVKRDIVTIGSQKRLEIRNYYNGQLRCFESYPYSEEGLPGAMTERYSEEGNLIDKSMYDYQSEKMKSLRIYVAKGADVKRLGDEEYTAAKTNSCNKQLDAGKERYTSSKNKLSIRWKKGELALLNSPLPEYEDGYIKWYYDGYHPEYGLHFFHYIAFESWRYFVMNDTSGEVYEYNAIDTPLFCGKSGLFLVVDENPYEGGCYVRIYKMFPEGRLAEIAILERGGYYYTQIDLKDFLWISESSFIASKNPSKEELQYDFYWGCADSCLAEYRKHSYLPDNEREWSYVQVSLHPDALETEPQELPSLLARINEINEWMESLSKTSHDCVSP